MYQVVIGLEVHCELTTKSKNFSPAPNFYTNIANSNVAAIDLGLPGILPRINKEACQKSLKLAMALNCQLPDQIMFDRKNYFYADLPKGFQITQVKKPMGRGGYLDFYVGNQIKRAEIHQLHLEEDTASLEHGSNYSLIDYNRSGIPLVEIVSKPCFYSMEEAVSFLEALRDLILYCEASEARTDKGQMRCDVNVSLKEKDSSVLGTKVEVKNLNSMTSIKAAIEYEIKRQTELLNSGEKIIQETRRVGDDLKTYSMRDKVDAVDYKYYVEPNLPPIKITDKFLEEIKKDLPQLPFQRIEKYTKEYGVALYDAVIIAKDKKVADYYESSLKYCFKPIKLAKWVSTVVLGSLNKLEIAIEDYFISSEMLAKVVEMIEAGRLSELHAKNIIYEANEKKISPVDLIEEKGIKQITDQNILKEFVLEILEKNPNQIEDYFNGKDYVANYFVGQVMIKTDKQANPKMTLDIVKEELEKRR